MSPTAPQLQLAVQQHVSGEPSNSAGSQVPVSRQFAYAQPTPRPLPYSAGAQHDLHFQQSSDGLQVQSGQQVFGGQQYGQQSQVDNEDYYEEDDEDDTYDDFDEHEYNEAYEDEEQGQDADGDQEMGEGMIKDPLYRQTLDQIEEWKRQTNTDLTDEQKARFAAHAAWKKQQGPVTSKKRLAEVGDCDYSKDDMADAARAAKRQRIAEPDSHEFYKSTRKVYTCGPSNNPDLIDKEEEKGSDELDGLALDAEILGLSAEFKGERSGQVHNLGAPKPPPDHTALNPNFRVIETICSEFRLMIEITKHLNVKEIVKLYSVSRTFRDAVNSRFQSTIAAWAEYMSPAGWNVFYWKFYNKYCILDPAGKYWGLSGPITFPRPPWAGPPPGLPMQRDVRHVPGFKYLAMLEERERRTRDILACLARSGHRMPRTMHVTLKKIWMLMDMATCNQRRGFIRNPDLWTDRDLYNAQMFFIKLNMRFNEPIFGPNSTILAETFLGAREGLTPLWELLRRKSYNHPNEIIQRRVKYWVSEEFADHYMLMGEPYFGVLPWELGCEHKEGWGSGVVHLRRPDELVIEECLLRGIDMKPHFLFMHFWGHVDWHKRLNLVPTEDEMYMSDEELPPLPKKGKFNVTGIYGRCGNVPFDYDNWQPKHSMKARWKTLKRAEKLAIIRDDEQEQLCGLPYEEENDEEIWNPYNVHDPHHPKEDSGKYEDQQEQDQDQPQYEDGDDEDTASFQTCFQPSPPPTNNVMYPLFPKEEDEVEGDVIEKLEYEYIDEEPLELPNTVTDPEVIDNWNDMDSFLQQKVIDEEKCLQRQDRKDSMTCYATEMEELNQLIPIQSTNDHGTQGQPSAASAFASGSGEPGKPKYHYEYPGVTDPLLLELLRQYDRFSPDAFCCDEDGNPLPSPKEKASQLDSDGDQDMDGDEDQPDGSSDEEDGVSIDSDDFDAMDDEMLKALADEEYEEEELEFDMERYQDFLERIGDNGGFEAPDTAGKKDKGKSNNKGKMRIDRSDAEEMETAYEGDLDDDDDIPLPEYDFRKY